VGVEVAGCGGERRVGAGFGVGVAGFDGDGGVVDAGLEGDAVELADVLSSGRVPVGGLRLNALTASAHRAARRSRLPHTTAPGFVAVVGAGPGEAFRGGRLPGAEHRMPRGDCGGRLGGRGWLLLLVWFGFGHQVGAHRASPSFCARSAVDRSHRPLAVASATFRSNAVPHC
jgi:hypothetical protein